MSAGRPLRPWPPMPPPAGSSRPPPRPSEARRRPPCAHTFLICQEYKLRCVFAISESECMWVIPLSHFFRLRPPDQTFHFWCKTAANGVRSSFSRARRARRCVLDPLTETGQLRCDAVGHRPVNASGALQPVLERREQRKLVATAVHLDGFAARRRAVRLAGGGLPSRLPRWRVAHACWHDCRRAHRPLRRTLGGGSPR